jgi:hypothetical protein
VANRRIESDGIAPKSICCCMLPLLRNLSSILPTTRITATPHRRHSLPAFFFFLHPSTSKGGTMASTYNIY